MSDARASVPWETIRSGLRLLATVWGVQIGFTVLNRFLWTVIVAALGSSSSGSSLFIEWIRTIVFLTEWGFTVICVALAVAASRLTRFPLIEREVTPANPYRGARDAGPTRDPGLDRPARAMVAVLGVTAGLGPVSYVYTTWLAPADVPGRHPLGLREGLWALMVVGALVAGTMFTIWAIRAARATSRPLSRTLPVVSFLLLALRGAFEVWDIVRRLPGFGYSSWTHWVGLALECASTGVLIVLALAVVEALRDQPGSPGAALGVVLRRRLHA